IAIHSGGKLAGLKRRVYKLTVGKGRGAPSRRCIEDAVTLGSHEGNTLVIQQPTVSRFHARIELDPLGWLLTDLDSTNGTFVGGTGSGKDVAANEIHRNSPRRNGPFVVVDCGGMPEALIEAELFGHERGAFTGADRQRVGAFEDADGGTLFLDEVAELPLSL